MARRKKQEEHENHERWLVSYADFITLLFAFFVVMFASSQADAKKAAVVSEGFRQAYQGEPNHPGVISRILGRTKDPNQTKNPGEFAEVPKKSEAPTHAPDESPKTPPAPPPPPTIEDTYGLLKLELAKQAEENKLHINVDRRGLVISLNAGAFFPSGEDRIAPDMYPTIQTIAGPLGKMTNPVRLEGHTDSIPIRAGRRFSSNWHLSAARSVAMLELFMKFGIPAERMAVVGYAETKPLDTNDTPDGRARNRRVDIVLLNDTARGGEPGPATPLQASEIKKEIAKAPVESAPFWRRWLHL